jgi:hypothetical protein
MADCSYRVVIGQNGAYNHTFGHDPELRGLAADTDARPAHLLLSLDTSDPKLTQFDLDVGPTLRLVHPYFYSQGQTFVYAHGANEIIFTKPLNALDLDDRWPSKNYPAIFPSHVVDLVPGKPNPNEWNDDKIYISKDTPTLQDETGSQCEGCDQTSLVLLAIFPNTPLPNLNLWGGEGLGVTTEFWYCGACHAINTHNSCD